MVKDMNRREEGEGQREAGLLETIDTLVYHINEERTWFNILVATSILATPITLFFTLFLLLHRRLLIFIFRLDPSVGIIAIMYFAVILIVASLWLVVGIKEFKFLSKWNSRFRQYFSLKEQLDKELRREFGEAEQ